MLSPRADIPWHTAPAAAAEDMSADSMVVIELFGLASLSFRFIQAHTRPIHAGGLLICHSFPNLLSRVGRRTDAQMLICFNLRVLAPCNTSGFARLVTAGFFVGIAS